MAIWNLLRDFFVQYIFGGKTSTGLSFAGVLGYDLNGQSRTTSNTVVNMGDSFATSGGQPFNLSIGDYLSTTATIITLVVFVGILFLFLKWLFKVISGFILLK